MRKLFLAFLFLPLLLSAQLVGETGPLLSSAKQTGESGFRVALMAQKTEKLYWENGLGVEYASENLLNKRLVLKAGYLTSRIGTALVYPNALTQDQFNLGAEWRFRPGKPLQIAAGLQTGFFMVDYEDAVFQNLPNSSALLAIETGVRYRFSSLEAGFTVGYHAINGNGIDVPGSLFPVYYKFGLTLPISLFKHDDNCPYYRTRFEK